MHKPSPLPSRPCPVGAPPSARWGLQWATALDQAPHRCEGAAPTKPCEGAAPTKPCRSAAPTKPCGSAAPTKPCRSAALGAIASFPVGSNRGHLQGISAPACRRSAPFADDALLQADVLIPIPLSKQRLSQRGFNQSLILAHHLSRAKTQSQTLLRMIDTPPQSSLKRSQRLTNLADAFAVAPLMALPLRGQNILLIDDVLTSGATLNFAARVLKQAGAAHVGALVLAKTPE